MTTCCVETGKDKQPPSKREISETKSNALKKQQVYLTLDLPFSVYQENPAKFEKDLIKELSKALNIDESRIRFIEARKG